MLQLLKKHTQRAAFLLSITLSLPNSAFALRDQELREKKPDVLSGLEEALRGDLQHFLKLTGNDFGFSPTSVTPAAVPTVGSPIPSTGLEEVSSASEERSVALMDKYLIGRPESEIDPDIGLFGMGNQRVIHLQSKINDLLNREVRTLGAVQITIPESEIHLDINLLQLWGFLSGRYQELTVQWVSHTTTGNLLIGPAQLVLVETGNRPFISTDFKLIKDSKVRLTNQPIPEGLYRIPIRIAGAEHGATDSHELRIYLPRTLLELQAPLAEESIVSEILLEATLELVRRVALIQGSSLSRAIAQSEALRGQLQEPDGPLGLAGLGGGLSQIHGPGGLKQVQEALLASRLTVQGFRPISSGLNTVLSYAPDRISDYLDALDHLVEFYREGKIQISSQMQPHSLSILNSLAALFIKNRVAPDILHWFFHHLLGGINYDVQMKGGKSRYTPARFHPDSSAQIAISEEPVNRTLDEFEEYYREYFAKLEFSHEEVEDIYWEEQLIGHLRSENAHYVDFELMKLMDIDGYMTREDLTEYQDLLEAVLIRLMELDLATDEPPSREAFLSGYPDYLEANLVVNDKVDTYRHKVAKEMFGRVLPPLLERAVGQNWLHRDIYQIIFWMRILFLTSEEPDFIEELTTSAPTIEDFLDRAINYLRDRIRSVQVRQAPKEGIIYLRDLLRELTWIKELVHETGHFPYLESAAGLEEVGELRKALVGAGFSKIVSQLNDGDLQSLLNRASELSADLIRKRFKVIQFRVGQAEEFILFLHNWPDQQRLKKIQSASTPQEIFEAGAFLFPAADFGIKRILQSRDMKIDWTSVSLPDGGRRQMLYMFVNRNWDQFGRLGPGWNCMESSMWLAEQLQRKGLEPKLIQLKNAIWTESDTCVEVSGQHFSYVPEAVLLGPSVQVIRPWTFEEVEPEWRDSASRIDIVEQSQPTEFFDQEGVKGFIFTSLLQTPTALGVELRIMLVENGTTFYEVTYQPGFPYNQLQYWLNLFRSPNWAQALTGIIPPTRTILRKTRPLTAIEQRVFDSVYTRSVSIIPHLLLKLTPNAVVALQAQGGLEEQARDQSTKTFEERSFRLLTWPPPAAGLEEKWREKLEMLIGVYNMILSALVQYETAGAQVNLAKLLSDFSTALEKNQELLEQKRAGAWQETREAWSNILYILTGERRDFEQVKAFLGAQVSNPDENFDSQLGAGIVLLSSVIRQFNQPSPPQSLSDFATVFKRDLGFITETGLGFHDEEEFVNRHRPELAPLIGRVAEAIGYPSTISGVSTTGLEQAEARIAEATTRYDGLFTKNGTELADNQIIPHLSLAGRKVTLEIDLSQLGDIDPAEIAAISRVFTHSDEIVPEVWAQVPRETLPAAINQTRDFLVAKKAGTTDCALIDPEVSYLGELGEILRDRKTPGIVMTPAVLDAIRALKDKPRDLAILLAVVRQAGGIVLGFEIEEKAGQRKLYLYA